MLNNLRQAFIQEYGGSPDEISVYFAPGRVNLIGEHIDYNGGNVLPFALQQGTYLAVRKLKESRLRMRSMNYPFVFDQHFNGQMERQEKLWVNYPLGVMHEFQLLSFRMSGLEMYFAGNIPPESGLSSSASIEMLTAFALNDLFGFGLSMMDLVMLTQRAENNFVGTQCGIMDMYAIGFGKKGHALWLNTEKLTHREVPLHTGEYRLVVANTKKQRGLADSKYNQRLSECREALALLNQQKPAKSLCEYASSDLNRMVNNDFPDLLKKRACHVIAENERVALSVEALQAGDMESFGQLMKTSHASLKNDYEVSCFELDLMVEEALGMEGVAGARMTGAGFGGCTINLVKKEKVEAFIKNLGARYFSQTGLHPEFYPAEAADGPRLVD